MPKRFILSGDGITQVDDEKPENKSAADGGVGDGENVSPSDSIEALADGMTEEAQTQMNDLDEKEETMACQYAKLSGSIARFAQGEISTEEADDDVIESASEIEDAVEEADKSSKNASTTMKKMEAFILGNKSKLKAATIANLRSMISKLKARNDAYIKKSSEICSSREAQLEKFTTQKKAYLYGEPVKTNTKDYDTTYNSDAIMKEKQKMIEQNKSQYDQDYNRYSEASENREFRKRILAEGVTEPASDLTNNEMFPSDAAAVPTHNVTDTQNANAGTGDPIQAAIQENVLAKVAEALDFSAMKQFKGLLPNPMIKNIYSNMLQCGISRKVAASILDNAIMKSAQESVSVIAEDAIKTVRSIDASAFIGFRNSVAKMFVPSVRNIFAEGEEIPEEEGATTALDSNMDGIAYADDANLAPAVDSPSVASPEGEGVVDDNLEASRKSSFNKGGNIRMAARQNTNAGYAALRNRK